MPCVDFLYPARVDPVDRVEEIRQFVPVVLVCLRCLSIFRIGRRWSTTAGHQDKNVSVVLLNAVAQSFPSATAESPVSQAVRETRRQGTRMQEGEQVGLTGGVDFLTRDIACSHGRVFCVTASVSTTTPSSGILLGSLGWPDC